MQIFLSVYMCVRGELFGDILQIGVSDLSVCDTFNPTVGKRVYNDVPGIDCRMCSNMLVARTPFRTKWSIPTQKTMTMTHSEKSHICQMKAWPYSQECRGHDPTKKNLLCC